MSDRRNFEDAFREWSGRSGASSPVEVAASLGRRRSSSPLRMACVGGASALAAAAVLALCVVAWNRRAVPPRAPAIPQANPSPVAAPVVERGESDAVVLWLDDRTPVRVYLTDASARGAQ